MQNTFERLLQQLYSTITACALTHASSAHDMPWHVAIRHDIDVASSTMVPRPSTKSSGDVWHRNSLTTTVTTSKQVYGTTLQEVQVQWFDGQQHSWPEVLIEKLQLCKLMMC